MYEELIGELHLVASGVQSKRRRELLEKTADAIEVLDGKVQYLIERCDMADKNCAEAVRLGAMWKESALERMPRWIPVTEEPPLKVGDDGHNGYLIYANGYYQVADYTTDKFDNVPYFHVDGEIEPDVTHYMPLPEPPKEET